MKVDFQLYQVNVCRSHDLHDVIKRSHDLGTKAHGGYTFCGFAALVLLGKPHLFDINKLLVSTIFYYCWLKSVLQSKAG